ncbi:MAG: hypothetical protein HKP27_14285 [Myxococcales bacterium]|nr:hypothetical protein [Myxococcales bacterium]
MSEKLPQGFEDLERFVPSWVFGTERERNAFRVAQPYETLQDFYDSTLPHMTRIAAALDVHPLDALPRDAANLLELALMAMEVAPAIEYYQAPDVPNSVAYEKFEIVPTPIRYRVAD